MNGVVRVGPCVIVRHCNMFTWKVMEVIGKGRLPVLRVELLAGS